MTADLHDPPQQALVAFLRDLPQLWVQRPGQWVAYQSDRCLDFGARKHELYLHCFRQGLQQDQFVIFCIEPQETEMAISPVTGDADRFLAPGGL